MPADRRLLYLLQRATRAAIARANASTSELLGVSATQLATLSHVAKHPGCSMTAIAELFDLNKSAVSGMLLRLERAELLRREPNPKDGRGSRLFLTEKGESVRVESLPVIRKATADLTEGFTPEEVEVVLRFLNSIVDRCADQDEEETP